MQRTLTGLILPALVALLALAGAAAAGPPAICHPVEIGEARSLPWGEGGLRTHAGYDRARLADETVEILSQATDPLVHMETLRRAALYVENDRERALALLARLTARILDAEAAGRSDALAWLDAGYLVQCYHQSGLEIEGGAARGVAGYAWVRRALELRPDDAALEFAAAMVTVMAGITEHDEHTARARKLASAGSLVARNLDRHGASWTGHRRSRS